MRKTNLRKIFYKRDTTNWNHDQFTITKLADDTIPGKNMATFLERYDKNLLNRAN